MKLTLAQGIVVETVGSDVLVVNPSSAQAYAVQGLAAHALRDLAVRGQVNLDDSSVAQGLVDAGFAVEVLESNREPSDLEEDIPTPSRRTVLTAAAVGVTAGIVAMSLPTTATAASVSRTSLAGFWYRSGTQSDQPVGGVIPSGYFEVPSAAFSDPAIRGTGTVGILDVPDLGIVGLSVDSQPSDPNFYIGWGYSDLAPQPGGIYLGYFTWGEKHYEVTFQEPPQ